MERREEWGKRGEEEERSGEKRRGGRGEEGEWRREGDIELIVFGDVSENESSFMRVQTHNSHRNTGAFDGGVGMEG